MMKKIAAAWAALVSLVGLAGALPQGYTQVDYIESTGCQYVDTGCVRKNNTTSVCVANVAVGNSVANVAVGNSVPNGEPIEVTCAGTVAAWRAIDDPTRTGTITTTGTADHGTCPLFSANKSNAASGCQVEPNAPRC